MTTIAIAGGVFVVLAAVWVWGHVVGYNKALEDQRYDKLTMRESECEVIRTKEKR